MSVDPVAVVKRLLRLRSGYPTLLHHGADRVRLPVVRGQPAFRLAHDQVRVRLPANKTRVGKLPLSVPFEQVYLGDAQGLTGAAMARDNVDGEIHVHAG